jgi:hypothetical protein
MESLAESTSNIEISDDKAFISQKDFFKLIEEKKEDLCIKYINNGQLENIECTDDHGMTALQYASFRGLYNLTRELIKHGANVNANTHDQGYSALMFAAISNHTKVVQLLLDNNANIELKNQIGRSATQMAAFVNSTNAVDIINNYISKDDLEYFTKINSINETEPKLPSCCVDYLHQLLTGTNFSPVYIIKKIIQFSQVLMPNIEKIIKTLDAFISKSFNKTNDDLKCPNDILSFKLHYYKFIFEYLKVQFKIFKSSTKKSELDDNAMYKTFFDIVIKQFLVEEFVVEVKKNHRMFEEKFIRESIRQFPYKESGLIRQMVQILFKVKLGSEPFALYVLQSSLNGQRFGKNDEETAKVYHCATCSGMNAKLCSKCKTIAYCDQFCQRAHWFIHKKECSQLAESAKIEQQSD